MLMMREKITPHIKQNKIKAWIYKLYYKLYDYKYIIVHIYDIHTYTCTHISGRKYIKMLPFLLYKQVCFSFFESLYIFQIFYNKHFYNYRNVNNVKWLIETHFTVFTNYPTEIAPCSKSSQRDAKAAWVLKALNCQQGHNAKPPTETLVSVTQHCNSFWAMFNSWK